MNQPLLVPFLFLLLPACQDVAILDEGEAAHIYAVIHAHHDRIMTEYRLVQAELPQMQPRYDELQQVYAEARPLHRYVLYASLTDSATSADRPFEEDCISREQLRTTDRRLHALHEELAADHLAEGYAVLSAMHEQMVQHYRQALRLTHAAIPCTESPAKPDMQPNTYAAEEDG